MHRSLGDNQHPGAPAGLIGAEIRVRGQVQGVGFRPHVWRLATDLELTGDVRNDGAGVLIHANGDRRRIRELTERLVSRAPALAHVESVEIVENMWENNNGFHILDSDAGRAATPVTPDAAMCDDCRAELFNPADRRYNYPFLNCTHCGPRLSIIRRIPYDRGSTSMAGFSLCPTCEQEYRDPGNRRFHAQPTACADCGPRAWLVRDGLEHHHGAITSTAQLIRDGKIIAIRGLGGFHLVCDATNNETIERLRVRKQRPHKPLAVMAKDLSQVRAYVSTNDSEAQWLSSASAPIVLLPERNKCSLPASLAPGQSHIGFMLAHTPLHALLLAQLDTPVVATSGNISGMPPCTTNAQALAQLSDIADAFLLHDRDIVNRVDDSVLRSDAGDLRVIRRARGHAPSPLTLPPGFDDAPAVLATGSELKNTFCMLSDRKAVLSQHIGDLNNLQYLEDYCQNLALYADLYQFQPATIAVDMHPDYMATRHGRQLADEHALQLIAVQHHHAHIASCLAENSWPLDAGRVIGIALDGTGYGEDGTSWGGEILHVDYLGYTRMAHLEPIALPGGELAARQPWRNLLAQLVNHFGAEPADWPTSALPWSAELPVKAVSRMIAAGINCPLSSSAGRLFDAVSAALGLCVETQSFEGQAAMLLEASTSVEQCKQQAGAAYCFSVQQRGKTTVLTSARLWEQLFMDIEAGVSESLISARFHAGFANAIAVLAESAAYETGVTHIAMSGGVFQNALLDQLVTEHVQKRGFVALRHTRVPANDGGLSFGQAVVAAARSLKQE